MSSSTINLIDERAALQKNTRHCQNVSRALTKAVRESLIEESKRWAEKASSEIISCLEPVMGDTDIHRPYTGIKRWYQHTYARAPEPSWADMEKDTNYYDTL